MSESPTPTAGASAGRLAEIRARIEEVDSRLLPLLNERAALSLEVGRIKAHDPGIIFKPLREREVLDNLARQNTGPLPDTHLRAIWSEILSSSRALQRPQRRVCVAAFELADVALRYSGALGKLFLREAGFLPSVYHGLDDCPLRLKCIPFFFYFWVSKLFGKEIVKIGSHHLSSILLRYSALYCLASFICCSGVFCVFLIKPFVRTIRLPT